MKGVDVSFYHDVVDWLALKNAGIDFAICRTGYGKNGVDETFQRNVNSARAVGMKFGAYYYSYALNPADAIIEADFCKRIITEAGVLLELPVFFDMEDADGYKARHGFNFSKRNVTAICRAFLDTIKPLDCGVYASYSWLKDYIDWRSLGCAIWNAQWGSRDNFKGFIGSLRRVDYKNFTKLIVMRVFTASKLKTLKIAEKSPSQLKRTFWLKVLKFMELVFHSRKSAGRNS